MRELRGTRVGYYEGHTTEVEVAYLSGSCPKHFSFDELAHSETVTLNALNTLLRSAAKKKSFSAKSKKTRGARVRNVPLCPVMGLSRKMFDAPARRV
jgi:hypothetical protein